MTNHPFHLYYSFRNCKILIRNSRILEKVIANEGELTDEEQALIEYSQIPIINLLELELRKSGQRSVEAMIAGTSEFVEVICYDMVINFMEKMLAEATAWVLNSIKNSTMASRSNSTSNTEKR